MAFPNLSDIVTTTLAKRSGKIADLVTKNNALLNRLSRRGKTKAVDGGRSIYQEIAFSENGNGGWYSGYDTLPVAAQDVLSTAEFPWKQYAVPVVISGLEMLQNSGESAIINLLEERINVAESTMKNAISTGLYGDGTAAGGKSITGLDAALSTSPTTGVYGGVDRAVWPIWRTQYVATGAVTPATIQGFLNTLWASAVRGADRPDLIIEGSTVWGTHLASLQAIQRITDTSNADTGFPSFKYMDADVVLDGGIGGGAAANDVYMLNTNYVFFKYHKDRNMVPISPGKRYATNQDAEVVILGWMGNLTMSGAMFQARGHFA